MNERMTAIVRGGVQGVGFRYFVWQQARSLGLTGWVRNLLNGNVEVLAEGSRAHLEQLAVALRSGPPAADVKDCEIEWLPASDEFAGFDVKY